MRTLRIIATALAVLAVAWTTALSAQEAAISGYALYEEGVRLMAEAQEAYAAGDYDKAASLAAQAAEMFRAYDTWRNSEEARKEEAGRAISSAAARLDDARRAGAPESVPTLYEEAKALYDRAVESYEAKDWDGAAKSAAESEAALADLETALLARRRLSDGEARLALLRLDGLDDVAPDVAERADGALEAGAASLEALAWDEALAAADALDAELALGEDALLARDAASRAEAARARLEKAREDGLAELSPALDGLASVADAHMTSSLEAKAWRDAIEDARTIESLLDMIDPALSARAAMDQLDARIAWLEKGPGIERYPTEYANATAARNEAAEEFRIMRFAEAEEMARKGLAALASIPGDLPLPKYYVVRLIPGDRDTLSKIAGYPFVYGNPFLWTLLFEANKDLLVDPNNPHLILPGQILLIPSASGEYREGTWDPMKTYPAYPL